MHFHSTTFPRNAAPPESEEAAGPVSPQEAKLLLVLSQGEAGTRDLTHALALPQPRVSALTRDLVQRGWITYRVDKRPGAGRPRHVYRLRRDLVALLEDLRRREAQRHERNVELIERVLRAARRAGHEAPANPTTAAR